MLLRDLLTAFMLLTRLPVGRFLQPDSASQLSRCIWAFPIVGLVVNAAGGLVYGLAYRVGMPPLLAAAWALAATIIATGALHEDGLADMIDGFGGGATPARRMEIMRDSRIGSYGTLALILSVMVRAAAIAAIAQPLLVAAAMIVAGMLGRCGILVTLLAIGPARDEGLGAAMSSRKRSSVVAGLGFGLAAALLLLPFRPAVAAILLGFGCSLAVVRIAHGKIGGYTGDVLGAAEVITECMVLTVAASALRI